MAVRKGTITVWATVFLVVGVVVILAGVIGRGFEAEYGASGQGEELVPKITIAAGVVLVAIGAVLGWLRVSRSDDESRNEGAL